MQVVGQVGLKHVDAHLVHARGSAVAFDAAKRLGHKRQGNPAGKRVVLGVQLSITIHIHVSPLGRWAGVSGPGGPWKVFLSSPRIARKRP
ncbi:MAG TPA: hypothetical protein VMY37_25010, partial [Thermoguttaceae bacterium]|nr:hypothetical protein [Thermoguttaceae bacterium]